MRRFSRLSIAFFIICLISLATLLPKEDLSTARASEQPLSNQMIFKNGNILTMDESNPAAEAVLIQDNIILAVGTESDITALAAQDAEIVDL